MSGTRGFIQYQKRDEKLIKHTVFGFLSLRDIGVSIKCLLPVSIIKHLPISNTISSSNHNAKTKVKKNFQLANIVNHVNFHQKRSGKNHFLVSYTHHACDHKDWVPVSRYIHSGFENMCKMHMLHSEFDACTIFKVTTPVEIEHITKMRR